MVAQRAGTTRRQTDGAPAARLARRALHAVITVITVTALGVALAACSTSSDPVGNVATATLTVPEGTTNFKCTFHGGMPARSRASTKRKADQAGSHPNR